MNELSYIEECENCEINDSLVKKIESMYSVSLPVFVKKLLSYVPDDYFCGDWRILASDEILMQPQWMAHDFATKKILPLIDVGDMEYISYLADENKWAIVSDSDGVCFRYKDNLRDYLEDV